jgi:hypothetical protein
MPRNYGETLSNELALQIGPAVATTTVLNALPASDKPIGQIRLVTADFSFWVYKSSTVGWVPFGNGGSGPRYTQEFAAPAAAAAAGLHAATATTVAPQTLLTADLVSGGVTALAAYPRNVTFTTAGGTAADAPATAVITGTDIDDNALTETVSLAQTATIASGVKAFKTITSIVYAAGDGTGATIAVGFGSVFGLAKKAKVRQGGPVVYAQTLDGAVVTNGTFVVPATGAPYGTWSPSTAPNASHNYVISYEWDLS